MQSMERRLPQARAEGLLTQELPGDELLLYDTDRHHAHRLNRTARLVWQHCDGRTPVSALTTKLAQELNAPASEDLVWLALERLNQARLLRESPSWPPEAAGISRRKALRKWVLAGGLAVLLPVVQSLAAPTPAAAASGVAVEIRSDSQLKEQFAAVDAHEILTRLASLPIATWSYKAEGPAIRHIGPMAQEFAAAFAVGADERHIAVVDANGVTMAAIQALYQQLQERDQQLNAIRAELEALKQCMTPAAVRLAAASP